MGGKKIPIEFGMEDVRLERHGQPMRMEERERKKEEKDARDRS